MVSITEVRMSPDLRHATAFVKPLLGKDEEAVLKALRTNTAYLQREVAARVKMKYAARLKFLPDQSCRPHRRRNPRARAAPRQERGAVTSRLMRKAERPSGARTRRTRIVMSWARVLSAAPLYRSSTRTACDYA
jgi:hypothetical protein